MDALVFDLLVLGNGPILKQELQIGVVRGDAILRGKETTPVIWNLLVRHRLTSGEHELKDRVWRRLSFFDVIKGELVLRDEPRRVRVGVECHALTFTEIWDVHEL